VVCDSFIVSDSNRGRNIVTYFSRPFGSRAVELASSSSIFTVTASSFSHEIGLTAIVRAIDRKNEDSGNNREHNLRISGHLTSLVAWKVQSSDTYVSVLLIIKYIYICYKSVVIIRMV